MNHYAPPLPPLFPPLSLQELATLQTELLSLSRRPGAAGPPTSSDSDTPSGDNDASEERKGKEGAPGAGDGGGAGRADARAGTSETSERDARLSAMSQTLYSSLPVRRPPVLRFFFFKGRSSRSPVCGAAPKRPPLGPPADV